MSLNQESRFLSIDYLAKGLLENVPKRLQFLRVFPFYKIHGNSLRYVRTPELAPAEIIEFGNPIVEHTKLPEKPVVFSMTEFAAHFEIAYKSRDIYGTINDLKQVEYDLAIRQLLYRFSEEFESGSAEFIGLKQMISFDNTFDLEGGTLTLEDLDRAKGQIRTNGGESGMIITNQPGYEQIRAAYYARNQIAPEVDGHSTFDGWLIYINDMQPLQHSGTKMTTNIWLMDIGPHALHGIIPTYTGDHTGDSMFVMRETIRPDRSNRVVHVTWPVGLALGSQGGLAGIMNVGVK